MKIQKNKTVKKRSITKTSKTTRVKKKNTSRTKSHPPVNKKQKVQNTSTSTPTPKSVLISVSTPSQKEVNSKPPVKYLNNRDLLKEVIKSKHKGVMTSELAKMLQLLTSRYAKKGNFAAYTYNDDMQGYAMLMLVKTWNSFDPAKSQNPFAFFTQCIKNSFIQYLNYEKRQRDIRDEILVDGGLSPSFNYQFEHDSRSNDEEHEPSTLPTSPPRTSITFQEIPTIGEDGIPTADFENIDELITY